MRQDEALFAPATYRKRRHELQADRLVILLRARGEWDDTHTLAASQLRAAARAVDIAEYVAGAEPSPYAAQCYAQTTRELRETLLAYGLTPGGVNHDPLGSFIAGLDAMPTAQDHRPPF